MTWPPFPPPGFPRPPFFREEEGEEDEEEENHSESENGFRGRMRSEGFDPELVEMGIKVARNHMRPSEEAYRIGENYIKEMAK